MAGQRFPWGKAFGQGFGLFGITTHWALFNSFIPPLLHGLGLPVMAISFIMSWDNILNGLLQPWVGARSDRTHSRFGRRKPWLAVGAPLAALFFILVPTVRQNPLLLALAILGTDAGMALFRAPVAAYVGDLWRPEQRSQANGLVTLMGSVGTTLALLVGGALYRGLGVPAPFAAGSLVLLGSIAIVLWRVVEPATAPAAGRADAPGLWGTLRSIWANPDRSGLFLLLAVFCFAMILSPSDAFFTLYARHVLGLDPGSGAQVLSFSSGAFMLMAIPAGLFATRFGPKRAAILGLAGMLVAVVLLFLVRSPGALPFLLALRGGFRPLIGVSVLPMMYSLGGRHSTGALAGVYFFLTQSADVAGPMLAGACVQLMGNDYTMIWAVSAVFAALAIVAMLRVELGAPGPAQLAPAQEEYLG